MAPRGPAKTRDYDYSNVGKAGRRTGITLKEGKRDEHGMEDIEGMWSSPENSPLLDNGTNEKHDDSTGSDGMSMDEENAPGPADFLKSAKSARESYHVPPVARSPGKAGLAGSPRRTPGSRSSQSPQHDILSSSPSDGKGLGSAGGEPRQDISPLTNRSVNTPSFHHATSMRNKASKASEPAIAVAFSDSDANSQFNGDENADVFEQIQNDFADGFENSDKLIGGGQREDARHDTLDLDPQSFTPESNLQRQTKSSTRTRGNGRNGESRAQGTHARTSSAENQESEKKRKRPGRPPKSQAQPNPKDGVEEERPSKKTKASKNTVDEPKPSGNPQLDRVVENYVNRTGPLKGRSLYILKREAPTDNSTTHTRSGRVSVRPLAYWRNERCVYGDGEAAEGQRYPLSTIKEVIRTEEPEQEKRKANNRRSAGKSKSKKRVHEEESDSEEYIDTWEKNEGVLHGYVRKWDPEVQTGTEDEEVVDIAYAPSGIETRDVKGSKFRFAKLLSSPFLGSGIVELPPGGVKKPKNSKKMHMVFYVCHGRVQIDISGVQFSAGKGCVFQVPRGNYYSFANTHGKDARLFFTQGCVPMDKDDSAPESASKLETMDGDSATPVTRFTGAGKGRPKGKQKAKNSSKNA